MADQDTDALYKFVRTHHGHTEAKANGYRAQFFFRLEQRNVLDKLQPNAVPIVDIACGSGLMLGPLIGQKSVYGLDFNIDACIAANSNALPVLRGDAFNLPFAKGSVAQFINCQFLNQQTPADARQFIEQLSYSLGSGGQCIILWRNGRSLLHRIAHSLFVRLDRLRKAPQFPQYFHPLQSIEHCAQNAGLITLDKAVTLPLPFFKTVNPEHWVSRLLGASFLLVLGKPDHNSQQRHED